MKVTLIRKTAQSGDTNCPAMYATDRGTFLVPGKIVRDNDALAVVRDIGPDETVVEVPAAVLAGEAEAP